MGLESDVVSIPTPLYTSQSYFIAPHLIYFFSLLFLLLILLSFFFFFSSISLPFFFFFSLFFLSPYFPFLLNLFSVSSLPPCILFLSKKRFQLNLKHTITYLQTAPT